MEIMSSILVSLLSLITFFYISTAGDTMIPNQSMNDSQTLISEAGVFELGFFTPNNYSSNRYLGMWYQKFLPRQIVWVANREDPITTSNAVLSLTPDGNLIIMGQGNNTIIWSTGTSKATNPIVQLLDTGNLVLNDSNKLLWQSFDHPSNTLLPGMKLGGNSRANIEWKLTSWKSDSDPSPGSYTYGVYNKGSPEGYVKNGSVPIWRSGPWDGDGWDGFPAMKSNDYFVYNFNNNHVDEAYYSYEVINPSIVSILVTEAAGLNQRLVWVNNAWNSYWKLTPDVCDVYGTCGEYGLCESNGSPVASCKCLNGFVPRSGLGWSLRDWTGGCERRTSLNCTKGDGFSKMTQLKLPDTMNASSDSTKSLDECRDWCLKNCSCLAYAVTSPEGGGCINWFGTLIDIRDFSGEGGEDLYLRLASSELGQDTSPIIEKNSHSKKKELVIIILAIFCGVILISIIVGVLSVKQRTGGRIPKRPQLSSRGSSPFVTDEFAGCELRDDVTKDHELPLFDFYVIATSTNNFSFETKIGEGGFGPVHKGTLANGQEIAVKRLSQGSCQGVEEFKNEIKLIANLQHKNLVRLLGCCIKDEERLLVYEYLPNKSLDKFIFDPKRAVSFNWETRLGVIHGVAQGLLYLHKYSRLRIIHRDLKCSNILLDSEMNPKISDFGIARIFGGNQDQANTRRVVGTYGYMPPEYAINGFFSEKSDVFSFGVLVLEIVSGKKNSDFHQVGALLGRAWELWKEGRVIELMDPVLCHSCPRQELMRCVHVGLLCVQEDAAERPTMSSVVSFLGSEVSTLPAPNTVAFITWRIMSSVSHSAGENQGFSNELTITSIGPR